MIFIVYAPRKKSYRALVKTLGYHLARDTKHSSLAIPVCLNGELKEVQADIRKKKGDTHA